MNNSMKFKPNDKVYLTKVPRGAYKYGVRPGTIWTVVDTGLVNRVYISDNSIAWWVLEDMIVPANGLMTKFEYIMYGIPNV